ncbi:multicopper oxidase family protein [Micromonospora sp. ATCC 39149]|uniref:Multicopper oxidase domain-containing protein n=1 Tax=Micromonospora carbonacea TaxID=47853 RepID=A0A7D6CGS7_9ACTN|nr:multicopper oxidase domain-containing protein [Micromonospora sp. ATCC 39149]QLK01078.1 multicopper oxidase domain-containing protein [Micromonospora carbonacea]
MKRRSVFSLAALSGLSAAIGACSSDATRTPPKDASGFTHRLRIPPLARPEVGADGAKRFTLTLQAGGRSEFLPGKPTDTWGINGAYLGPTVRAARGDRVRMAVTNRLPEATTLHWHGMRLPARMDGGPHQMIEPGTTWTPEWTIEQPATTAWFHPHPHERTAQHVYRGLAGLFLVDDPEGPRLPGEYGVDDVPLIVQDTVLDDDGALSGRVDGGTFGLLGDTILINGTYQPVFQARTELVRFRLLNASNARVYRIGFADQRQFHVIGTDAGALQRPVPVDRVKISPGERAEIVVRFTAGETTVMDSRGEPEKEANDIEEGDFALLRIVAVAAPAASPALPATLGGSPPEVLPPGIRVRRFQLSGSEINDKDMDMTRIDEVVPAGALEIWEIDNTTYAHNFHIHEVAFHVLDVNGQPPPAYQAGPKDTVFVPKKAKVRLAVRFGRHTDPLTPYMYHCHLLRHEDKGMMGQFVVVKPGTEQQVARTLRVGHHHHD